MWVAWDKRKQGWHDKLANTVVISCKDHHTPQEVSSLPRASFRCVGERVYNLLNTQ
nr:RDD family protein [Vibrio penaeicida]